MMTPQDHDKIAKAIAPEYAWLAGRTEVQADQDAATGIRIAVRAIASTLAHDNPEFNRVRFMLTAVGLPV